MFDLFGNRTKFVRAHVWRDKTDFTYPEASLVSLSEKADLGVAFSGGGTRSASAVAGQLRGLKAIGLLGKVKYISAVSGGAWGAGPFTFLPERFDEDEFLGEVLPPRKITVDSLNNLPKRSLLRAASDSVITDDFLKEAFELGGDETYARSIGNVFLEPFDLNDDGRFTTFDEVTLRNVLKENDKARDNDHYLEHGDFYVARPGRPFFVAGATLFSEQKKVPQVHVEFTPYYSGTRRFVDLDDPVGGGYLETVGCDSERPRRRGTVVKVKLGQKRHRFALSDIIGTSGAAPQELLRKLRVGFVGLPEYRHWALKDSGGFSDHEELSYGDGGHLENLGIMPLLARGVSNIIVFVNSKTKFVYNEDPDNCRIASSIPNLFKPAPNGFKLNLVIKDDDKHSKYKALLKAFAKAQNAGESLIHVDSYDIRRNVHYSVKARSDVRICWVYNQNVQQWFSQLPFQTKKLIEDGEVARFPHYKTFFQNPPKVIDLSRAEAGLLAHLSCWNVTENKGLLAP